MQLHDITVLFILDKFIYLFFSNACYERSFAHSSVGLGVSRN